MEVMSIFRAPVGQILSHALQSGSSSEQASLTTLHAPLTKRKIGACFIQINGTRLFPGLKGHASMQLPHPQHTLRSTAITFFASAMEKPSMNTVSYTSF